VGRQRTVTSSADRIPRDEVGLSGYPLLTEYNRATRESVGPVKQEKPGQGDEVQLSFVP